MKTTNVLLVTCALCFMFTLTETRSLRKRKKNKGSSALSLALTFDALGNLVWKIAGDKKVTRYNAQKRKKIIQKNPFSFVDEDEEDKPNTPEIVIKTGEEETPEIIIVHPGSKEKPEEESSPAEEEENENEEEKEEEEEE
ncbi:unnamed protein product [Owenia fusiformis]|uniref:Uncharacterized protein n=1 Tax=Owenia fusiformis TaxID=6347 RepID=A0A8J1UE15_OWEFU|nr:unnamed protein product [Owenia fusiformis]